MLMTTLNEIRACSPCHAGWEKLLQSLGKTMPDDEPISFATILESNGLEDTIWSLRANVAAVTVAVEFAQWCAAYAADAAKAAAYAATYAADAADADAAYAVAAYAADAAYAAAYAAYAVAYAATYAADAADAYAAYADAADADAAYDAARSKQKDKLMELITR